MLLPMGMKRNYMDVPAQFHNPKADNFVTLPIHWAVRNKYECALEIVGLLLAKKELIFTENINESTIEIIPLLVEKKMKLTLT